MSRKLTAKQQRFIQEYLIDLNATRAAIRAGYSEKTATEIGYENLRKPHVAAAVVVGAKKAGERAQVDTDYVLRGLVKEAELTGEGSSQAAQYVIRFTLGSGSSHACYRPVFVKA